MLDTRPRKRGPSKKEGFRQELRVTPVVEQVFGILKEEYKLKNNSEALNKIAQIYYSKFVDAQEVNS